MTPKPIDNLFNLQTILTMTTAIQVIKMLFHIVVAKLSVDMIT